MDEQTDKELLKRWVENWKETGEILEEMRRVEIRNGSPQDAILALTDAFISAISLDPPRPTSGLIEQQKYFKKLKK